MPHLRKPQEVKFFAFAFTLLAAQAFGQPQAPYATIDRNAVNYAGPGRDAAHDLSGTEITIGLLMPLSGPSRAEGEGMIQAAQLAIEEEGTAGATNSPRLALAVRDENGPWGQAASEVVRLVQDDKAIALITSPNGLAAHLAEQVAAKLGVPVLTLAGDTSTTQINIPWIFRLGPSDLDQARLIAQDIYTQRGLTRAVLVTELTHDGRVGGEDFEKVVKELVPDSPLSRISLGVAPNGAIQDASTVVQQITTQNPEAVVVWTGPQAASELVAQIHLPSIPIYLCGEASAVAPVYDPREQSRRSQGGATDDDARSCRSCPVGETGGIWKVAVDEAASGPQISPIRTAFVEGFRHRTGRNPSEAETRVYDGVRLIAATVRQAGPNRARLRDALAETGNFRGATGVITFDHAGNNSSPLALVPLR